jgi:hypothetical protein
LTGWWAVNKLTNETYKRLLMRCKRNYKGLVTNFDAVVSAEQALEVSTFRKAVAKKLDTTKLPFKARDDPLFQHLDTFLEQYLWATERYQMYALQGPSQAAKTSFVKSRFKNPYVITIQVGLGFSSLEMFTESIPRKSSRIFVRLLLD